MTEILNAADGWTADQVFSGAGANTMSFDNIALLPGAEVIDESTIHCSTKLTKNSPAMYIPIVAGPSETVVGVDMAIALALAGGVGIIHRNQSVEAQCEMVKRVKQYQNGFILNPQTLGPNHTVADLDVIKATFGYGAIPITENGKMGGKFMGLVTSRDVENLEDRSLNIKMVMTKAEDLVLAQVPAHFRDIQSSKALQTVGGGDKAKSTDVEELMFTSKVGKLPVVNDDMELVALICRGDINRARLHPQAARDATRQLLCAASVASSDQDDWFRCQALIDAGVDIVCLDTDDGVTDVTVDFVKRLKEEYTGNVEVLAGRVSSVKQATELLDAGVDGLRIGSFACGGAAEATAVYEISRIARFNYGVPCCAEAVRDASQMFKALCLGASSVTMTDMLSRCAEAAGDHYYRDGVRVKLPPANEVNGNNQRGNGLGVVGPAVVKKAVVGATVDRGSAGSLLPYLSLQVKKGLRDLALPSISETHMALSSGALRIERQLSQQQPPSTLEQNPRTVRLATSALHNRW